MCNNNSINSDEKSSVLIDKTKSGKIRPWREKKMANVDYFELLHILEFKKAERVKDCAEVLEYKVSYETGEKTLYRVWFCKLIISWLSYHLFTESVPLIHANDTGSF